MPEAPFIEEDSGELWVREGELYSADRDALLEAFGAIAILHTADGVFALVRGKGWVSLDELAKGLGKPALQAVK